MLIPTTPAHFSSFSLPPVLPPHTPSFRFLPSPSLAPPRLLSFPLLPFPTSAFRSAADPARPLSAPPLGRPRSAAAPPVLFPNDPVAQTALRSARREESRGSAGG